MTKSGKKSIYIILISFSIILLLTIVSNYLSFQQSDTLKTITSKIYEHPLKVSNAALSIKSNIYIMHDSMLHIVNPQSEDEIKYFLIQIKQTEQEIYKNLNIIKQYILGTEGAEIEANTRKMFDKCKQIRKKIFTLINNNKIAQAKAMVENTGMENTLKLIEASDKLYNYAQNKASDFMIKSQQSFDKVKFFNYEVSFILLLLFLIIIYYTINRIAVYIAKNEHLTGVLGVIRDVNQLIVREKDEKSLIEKTCEILTSTHIYTNVWITLYGEEKDIKYCISNEDTKEFNSFKQSILNGNIPKCINKTINSKENYSYVKNTLTECTECALKDFYHTKNAFTIKLQYNNEVYGFLTLALESKFINDKDELNLLEEVAGDIGYAIFNLKNENEIHRVKELYDHTMNSIDNLIFVKDTKFNYITCNNAFAQFVGKTKDSIIGKTDYNLFDKEIADSFRKHDEIMLTNKKSISNFEWITYPDSTKQYLLTTKAPLLSDNNEILGLVGNSVDITKQKNIEDTLKIVNYRYKTTEQIGHVGSWEYDIDSTNFWGSNEAKRIYGFNEDDEFFTTEKVEGCIIERERVHQALIDLIEKEKEYNLEFEIRPMDNSSKKTIHAIAKVEYDTVNQKKTVRGFIEDITERKANWNLLEQKKKELETIIQEAPNPIMLHNEDGKVLLINKAWEELTGYNYEDINTIEKWTKQAYGKEVSTVKKHIDSLYNLNQKVDEGEYKIVTKKGNTVLWKFSSTPLGEMEGRRVVISSAMDVTELKQKEEMLINQSRHAAMGEMISMIAHQWRQPLSIISMDINNLLVDIDLDSLDSNEVKKLSNNILHQTAHLSQTIDDFSNFFKPEKTIARVEIKTILDETYTIVKDSLVNNNIQFIPNIESHLKINAYTRELMQVFLNIINNAKYALIERKIDNAFIKIRVYNDDKYMNTQICDNANGIDKNIIAKIFEPYFTTKEKNGTGLGLYMSKMIIEEHLNGILEVANSDVGACFTVRLPLDKELV